MKKTIFLSLSLLMPLSIVATTKANTSPNNIESEVKELVLAIDSCQSAMTDQKIEDLAKILVRSDIDQSTRLRLIQIVTNNSNRFKNKRELKKLTTFMKFFGLHEAIKMSIRK